MIARQLVVQQAPTSTFSNAPPIHYVGFTGMVSDSTAQRLLAVVGQQIQMGAKQVCLLLSTPGGDVAAGMFLYNILRGLPCQIITHNTSRVNSIGNVVFLAGEQRYASPGATFLFHGVACDFQQIHLDQKNGKAILDTIAIDTSKIARVIENRATFENSAEVEQLFLQENTKDCSYAKEHDIIHDVRDVQVPQ